MNAEIRELLLNAQLVLVGIGEEFYSFKALREDAGYSDVAELLEVEDKAWLIPLWNYYYVREKMPSVGRALSELAELLKNKNYYVVSVCANGMAQKAGFKEGRMVSPCGSAFKLQCPNRCEGAILELSEEEALDVCAKMVKKEVKSISLRKCPVCGQEMCLNNVYTEKYDESGYLPDWNVYTKWLQGTLNRELCILELGVNLTYPSVIRFPFEKIGFYNQKASFVRVNETLYQLAEDLKDKGVSIPKNSIDWLLEEDL